MDDHKHFVFVLAPDCHMRFTGFTNLENYHPVKLLFLTARNKEACPIILLKKFLSWLVRKDSLRVVGAECCGSGIVFFINKQIAMNMLRHVMILSLSFCLLTCCRSTAKLFRDDEKVWKYRQPSTLAVPYADTSFRLYRVITVERPRDIYYSGLTFIQVTAQIAGAYHKRYLKFAASIDTSQRGALGGGETLAKGPLSELLYHVTSGTSYSVYGRRDTLVITNRAQGEN